MNVIHAYFSDSKRRLDIAEVKSPDMQNIFCCVSCRGTSGRMLEADARNSRATDNLTKRSIRCNLRKGRFPQSIPVKTKMAI
jgi:hypothetical protein